MSKKKTAKQLQGYVDKVIPDTCSICAQCVPVMGQVLMYKDPQRTSDGTHYVSMPVSQKCGIGDFSVKKMGACNRFTSTVHIVVLPPKVEAV